MPPLGRLRHFFNYTEEFPKSKLYVFLKLGETLTMERQKPCKAGKKEKFSVKTLVKKNNSGYSLKA